MPTTFDPTPEQAKARDLFATGAPLVIQAGAGTGKTSTLLLLANADERRGQYLAFNKAIVEDAKAKMPSRVAANTAHSLAFRTEGKRMAHRLKQGRVRAEDVARRLMIDPLEIRTEAGKKRLAPGFLAGYLMRAIGVFCQSADEVPGDQHFPYLEGIDLPTPDGRRQYTNQREVRAHLLPALRAAWADLTSTDGSLRFTHDCYLKMWQLSRPRIGADYIMLDEAQDTNPVLLDVFWRQAEHAQLVAVGDDCQAIYEWRGAVNALADLADLGADTAYLSQSFRFGQAVADEANKVLARLDAVLRLTGSPHLESRVGVITSPDCVLTRTNAAAMRVVLEEIAADRRPHLVGGGQELTSFCRATIDLQAGRYTTHPELACFTTWGEVQEYVENDQQGDELRLLVGLMDEYGPHRIMDALERMPAEKDASLVVSTAHKSKGREWDRVTLGSDFPTGELRPIDAAEWRLMYVAVTRAKRELDLTAVAALQAPPADKDAIVLPSFYVEGQAQEALADEVPANMTDCDTCGALPGQECDPGQHPDERVPVDDGAKPVVYEDELNAAALSERPCPGCGRTDVRREDGTLVMDSDHLGCSGSAAVTA